jgi:hypothetical protein
VQALRRFVLLLGLPLFAAAAQAQGAAVALGSFEPSGGATDGKIDCPSAGGWDDVVYAMLYQLPSDDYVVNVYRRQEDGGMVSILVSKQLSCLFRRMEFHSPARPQPTLQAAPQPAPQPVPR